ncbi:MAG: competence protein [Flavobacterium sp.]
MAFEEIKENTEAVQENAKAYVETTLAYYKLKSFKLAMKSTTLLVKVVLVSICLLIVLLFVSIAGALVLGGYLESYPLGFLIVAGIYFVLAFVMLLIKDKLVEGPVLEKFSEIFFND